MNAPVRKERGLEAGVAEPTEKKEPIKVVDRRSFAPDGSPRKPDAEGSESGASAGPGPAPRAGSPRSGAGPERKPPVQGEVRGERFTMEPGGPGAQDTAAEDAAFADLVVSIYQSGCIHLGLAAEEGGAPKPPDYEAARGAIDMLRTLRRKTHGNLSPDESHILDALVAELQMAFAMRAPGA